MTSLNLDRPLRAVGIHALLVLLALLVLPLGAQAAKLGEACGQLDGWSARCEGSLRCDIKPGPQGGRIGLCLEAPRRCGGLLGSPCGAGEYCDFPMDALCGAADQTGVCKVRPEVCTLEERPVCGCDDHTYANACAANAAGVSVSAPGACENESDTCSDDRQCPRGHCERGAVCRGEGCPPPNGQCVGCGDGTELRCRRAELPCPDGQVREIVDGCFGECVDRHSCEPAVAASCTYLGKTYAAGQSFPAADGCNRCRCEASGSVQCTLKACPDTCSNVPGRSYVSRSPDQCRAILFNCGSDAKPFFGACGCGCEKLPAKPAATACRVGGCSGQLCTSAAAGGAVSTCEWREEYACYRGASCAVQPSGQCGWTPTEALRSCLAGAR